jgi:hypothetical protein
LHSDRQGVAGADCYFNEVGLRGQCNAAGTSAGSGSDDRPDEDGVAAVGMYVGLKHKNGDPIGSPFLCLPWEKTEDC